MAAVAELSFLLFALINNIHAEQLITIKEEGDSYTFNLPKAANSCLISRFVGEEKLVLWNTSDLWSQNSTVPEDLKRRLFSRPEISSYMIYNLKYSDSGLYQEECWTEGNVTHERNYTITICSSTTTARSIDSTLGGTVDLPCFRASDNLDVQWLKADLRSKEMWTRVFGDNTTSVMDDVRGRYQEVTNSSDLRVSNVTITDFTTYNCLVMNQQQCVSSRPVQLILRPETIYRSEEETAVLPCTVADFTDDQPPRWTKFDYKTVSITDVELQNQIVTVDQNYSLVFSSLTLYHTGWYSCEESNRQQLYFLMVCSKLVPPAVELFSEGEEVTLRCRDLVQGERHDWFIKSNRTEGRTVYVSSDLSMSRVNRYRSNGSLVISNVSLEDTGEYWCAGVADPYFQCVSTSRTVLKYREPFEIPSTFYIVRCSVLSVLLLMLCVVVVAVNLWAKKITERV